MLFFRLRPAGGIDWKRAIWTRLWINIMINVTVGTASSELAGADGRFVLGVEGNVNHS